MGAEENPGKIGCGGKSASQSVLATLSSNTMDEPAKDFWLETIFQGRTETVSLADYKGRYLLIIFYPATFGHVTATEFHELEDELGSSFQQLKCELLAVTTAHLADLRLWWEADRAVAGLGKMDLRLAADPLGRMATDYRVWNAKQHIPFR